MKELSDGLPIIIDEKGTFECFHSLVKGKFHLMVYDKGTNEFPANVNVDTNFGKGGVSHTLKGNETIDNKTHGIEIETTISNWTCTSTELSFHVKCEAKKKVWPKTYKCEVIDRTFSGKRYNSEAARKKIEEMLQEVEQEMGIKQD